MRQHRPIALLLALLLLSAMVASPALADTPEESDTPRYVILSLLTAGGVATAVLTAWWLPQDDPPPSALLIADYVLGIANGVAGGVMVSDRETDQALFWWGVGMLTVGITDVALGIAGNIRRVAELRMKVIPVTLQSPDGQLAPGLGVFGTF
ncbi:MAG: putative MFS family arabinose efflux permease [Myxococcota bacterium]|jgi:predicted MFS family arabinose efflux permease